MDSRRRRAAARKAVPTDKPKPKRPIQKDMTLFARHMRLPPYPGFTTVAKHDISEDVRAIAGLPIPPTIPENDPLLLSSRDAGPAWSDGRGALPKRLLDSLSGRPTPFAEQIEADAMLGDERPEVLTAMEAWLFRGEEDEAYWAEDEEHNFYALPPPAVAMSGWTAARIKAEGADAGRVTTERGPILGAATGGAVTFGVPRGSGAGAALGMDGVKLDLGLRERTLAVLPVRRVETENRYLSLRRTYVGALKEYFVEAVEMGLSIEQLKQQAAAVKAVVRNGGKAEGAKLGFATDGEERVAVDRVAAAMEAVVRQNAQLRARLAAATGRVSGCTGSGTEPASAEAAQASTTAGSGVMLVVNPAGVAVTGGARGRGMKPPASAAGGGSGARATVAQGGDAMDEEDAGRGGQADVEMDGGVEASFTLRGRGEARSRPLEVTVSASALEPVLALGDLILTSYGRGVVVKQRDLHLLKGEASPFPLAGSTSTSSNTPAVAPSVVPSAGPVGGRGSGRGKGAGKAAGAAPAPTTEAPPPPPASGVNPLAKPVLNPTTTMVEAVLQFGARAFILSSQVVLLAVAGEEYSGPEGADALLLASVLAARAKAAGRPAALFGTAANTAYIAKADDILYGPPKPSHAAVEAEARLHAKAGGGALPAVASAAAKGKAAVGTTLGAGLHGSTAADAAGEALWSRTAASRVCAHIEATDGIAVSHRTPVFQTPWDRNTVPRGIRLHIDPMRGTSTLGYVTGVEAGVQSMAHLVAMHAGGTAGAVEGAAGGGGDVRAAHHPAGPHPPPTAHAGGAGVGDAVRGRAADTLAVAGSVPRHGEASQQVRELFAEVQRQRARLRLVEEECADRRKRLNIARVTITRMLDDLTYMRAGEKESVVEISMREKEVADMQARIHELRAKYEPQALAADEAREAEAAARQERESGTSAAAVAASKAMEALVASMSADAEEEGEGEGEGEDMEEDEEEEEEADAASALQSAGKAHVSPLRTGGPASSPSGRLSGGVSGSNRKVPAGRYGGIMGSKSNEEDSEASEKEEEHDGPSAGGAPVDEEMEVEAELEGEGEAGAAGLGAMAAYGEEAASEFAASDAVADLGAVGAAAEGEGLIAALTTGADAGADEALLMGSLSGAVTGASGGGAADTLDAPPVPGRLSRGTGKRPAPARGRGGRGASRGGKRARTSLDDVGGGAGGAGGAAGEESEEEDAPVAPSQDAATHTDGVVASQGTPSDDAGSAPARRGRSAASRGRR